MPRAAPLRPLAQALQRSKWQKAQHHLRRVATAAAASVEHHEPAPLNAHLTTDQAGDEVLGSRRQAIKEAKPFSDFLTDNFNRQHDYLRISVTERCNLRCLYCMPEEGVPLSPNAQILTTPEMYYLSSLFVSQGVTKIRLTGGEPTVRPDIVPLMQQIGSLSSRGLRELALTTNGISLHRKLDKMVEAGLTGLNISLDTLDPFQFQILTRRKGFDAVMKSIDRVLELNRLGAGIKLKVNCVVMRGINEREIIPFVEMGREKDIEVRFIEYMPFDGNRWSQRKMLSYKEMLEIIREKYPGVRSVKGHINDTSKTYEVPGFVGKLGFITSMTHNFCGTCNRLRITSDGNLKVCLFGNAEVSLRDIIRKENNNQPIDQATFEAIRELEMNRHEGLLSGNPGSKWSEREVELLDVIGMAVKRKKEKHAGMGELENMKNRPMILIAKNHESQNHVRSNPVFSDATGKSGSRQWSRIPLHMLHAGVSSMPRIRTYSTSSDGKNFSRKHAASTRSLSHVSKSQPIVSGLPAAETDDVSKSQASPILTHVSPKGEAHMVDVTEKSATSRVAVACGYVQFSNSHPYRLISENTNKKGDVLGVSRIAGIMAAKRCSDIIPLCHPIAISKVTVDIELCAPGKRMPLWGHLANEHGAVLVEAQVHCRGPTGVEMEALTAVSGATLTVYDMCKAVDKGMVVGGIHVVLKEGGKSGDWSSSEWQSRQEPGSK